MTTPRVTVISRTIWAVVLLTLLIGACWAVKFRRNAEIRLVRLNDRHRRLNAEISEAERRAAEARRSRLELELQQARATESRASLLRDTPMNRQALLRASPQLQALYLESMHAQRRNNTWLNRALGLSPEQAAKLADIDNWAMDRRMDLRWAAEAQGEDMRDPTYRALQQQVTDQAVAQEKTLLGDQGYAQMQDLERLEPVGYVTGQIGSILAQSATPLTSDQLTQLTDLLAASSSAYQNGKMATLVSVDWKAVLNQAQGFMTSPQIAVLQETAGTYQANELFNQLARMAQRVPAH